MEEFKSIGRYRNLLFYIGMVIFLFLVSLGFYLLYISRTGNHILTPWQTIHSMYIYVFFVATLLLGVLIIFYPTSILANSANLANSENSQGSPNSNNSTNSSNLRNLTLFFLILYSLLLHSYLPLTHNLIYGADQWRHMANEKRIMLGLPYKEAVIANEQISNDKFQIKSKIQISNVGTIIGRLSYTFFWYVNAGLAAIVNLFVHDVDYSLVLVNKWFMPILSSIFYPLLCYAWCRRLGRTQRTSLFVVWLSALPFALQTAGSFTLPVNLGFLIWMAEMLLIFRYIQNPERKRLYILLSVGVLSIFNYTLFFILYWVALGVAVVVSKRYGVGGSKRIIVPLMVVVSALSLPAAELLFHYSHFGPVSWFAQIKQLFGNFLGLYLANGPRPHIIPTGNILFNQMPSYAYVPNALTVWRWWIPLFALGFWSVELYGWWQGVKKDGVYRWLAILSSGVLGSYIVSRYFLAGEQVLTRRLDVVIAFFSVIFFAVGVKEIVKLRNWEIIVSKKFLYFCISLFLVILSFAITASYSLGPDTDTVSVSEYKAMRYVWNREKGLVSHCVIADTYPLLALEAISSKDIIGGGFPISVNFSQPEMQSLYGYATQGLAEPNQSTIELFKKFPSCWLVDSEPEVIGIEVSERLRKISAFTSQTTIDWGTFGGTVVQQY